MRKITTFLCSIFLFALFLLPVQVHAESDAYVSDTYGVLSAEELEELNTAAQELSDKYQFGVYAHIVFDNDSYDDIWGFAERYWQEMDLGYGNSEDGILFIITQSDRGGSYNVYVPSSSDQDYFTIDALEDIEACSEQGLFDHDYSEAIRTYLDKTEEKLAFFSDNGFAWSDKYKGAVLVTSDGKAVRQKDMLIIFGIPPAVALVIVIAKAMKHRTKFTATSANNYISPNGKLHLTQKTDRFINRTKTRVRVVSNNNSNSGGGGHSSSGGMHSGGGHF